MKVDKTYVAEVRKRIGSARIKKLAQQPLALAAGGVEALLQVACAECAGYADNVTAAARRTMQLCGSMAPETL